MKWRSAASTRDAAKNRPSQRVLAAGLPLTHPALWPLMVGAACALISASLGSTTPTLATARGGSRHRGERLPRVDA
jgi:hypothetical protein